MSGDNYAVIPIAVDIFLIILASLALVLRIISRRIAKAPFWWDDWLALAAWPFSIGISASFLAASFHGFGGHGGNPTFFLHALYFDEIWYNAGIALTKLSVLCFYYRIFTPDLAFRRALWITGGLVVLWWITFEMASIFQCVPISAYWDPHVKAVCVEKFAFFMGQAVPNIALDFALLLLPVKPLWKLQMQTSHRLAVLFVFVLGYLNPVISILRIVSFIQLGKKTGIDINYNFVGPALWSAAEVAVAIFSCSVPSMAHLFRRVKEVVSRGSQKSSLPVSTLKDASHVRLARKHATWYQNSNEVGGSFAILHSGDDSIPKANEGFEMVPSSSEIHVQKVIDVKITTAAETRKDVE